MPVQSPHARRQTAETAGLESAVPTVLIAGTNGLLSLFCQFSLIGKLAFSRKQATFSWMTHFS